MTTTTHRRRGAAALLVGAAVAGLTLGACSQDPSGASRPVAAVVAPATSAARPAGTDLPPAAPATPAARATAAPAVQQVPVPVTTAHPAPARPAAPVDPDALPWGQVGLGWSAAVYSTHPSTQDGAEPTGPFTVALVSPSGKRWTVGSTATPLQIDDVAPDGQHVLARTETPTSTQLVELDTRTHVWRSIMPAMSVRQAFYTNPTAQQVVVTTYAGSTYTGTERILRLDRSGRTTLDVSYPSAVMPGVVPTADGRFLVTERAGVLAVLGNATGAVVRSVTSPQGYHDCRPIQLWSGSQVSVACQLDAAPDAYVADVLLLDAATGRWSAVTHADVSKPTFGYVLAWPVTSGSIAMEATGCGPGRVGPIGADGQVSRFLSWPGAQANPMIVGVAGNTAFASYGSCGGTPTMKLVAQDVSTHRTVTLLSAPWLDAAVIDGR